jgi:hypothetical protein
MFYGLDMPLRRPTKDIDFLCSTSKEDIAYIIEYTLSISVPDDCITFDPKTINISATQTDADHHGLRVRFIGCLGKMKIPMQIDIGFSDEIASPALNILYPTLLPEHSNPKIKGYPPEAIISEKFHAMVRFGGFNSRWKDCFDIWLLSDTFDFECDKLQRAIKKTFDKRSTLLPTLRPYALATEFADANNKNWNIFLKRSKLQIHKLNNFASVVEDLWTFLEFPLQRLRSSPKPPKKYWRPHKGWI